MTWLPGFQRRDVVAKLTRLPQHGRTHQRPVDKLLLHTTEGSTASAAFGAYDARAGRITGGVHPHVTVDPARRTRYQHVPLDRSSYALKDGDRDGVIQVEIVGRAAHAHFMSSAMLDWLGSHVVAPIVRAQPGIPLERLVEFLGADVGLLAAPWPRGKARLSPIEWDAVRGVVGHQHAPYDDHWDPGRLDVDRIISSAVLTLIADLPPTIDEDDDAMRLYVDTTTGAHWVIDTDQEIIAISDPGSLKWDGPVTRSANMRYVLRNFGYKASGIPA